MDGGVPSRSTTALFPRVVPVVSGNARDDTSLLDEDILNPINRLDEEVLVAKDRRDGMLTTLHIYL